MLFSAEKAGVRDIGDLLRKRTLSLTDAMEKRGFFDHEETSDDT